MTEYHTRLSGAYINEAYRRKIGSAIWLLLYLTLKCDWEKGNRNFKEQKIADALGVSIRTIRNWLRNLEEIGVSTKRRPYSIEVQLPPGLIPNREKGNTLPPDRQTSTNRPEKPQQETGKTTAGWQKLGDAMGQQYKRFKH